MRRVVALMAALALLLTACGGGATTVELAAPPGAQPVEQIENEQVQQIIDGWKRSVPAAMQQHQIKAETIQQTTYQSSGDLKSIETFYSEQLPGRNEGWTQVPNLPGLQAERGFLLTGYSNGGGMSNVVIGAIDASAFGGEGVVVYTAQGHK